ncbi:hypothetical protein A3756_18050 [Oleiphilus sp. HI0086]|nr:hypothetical protein A3735_11675 [Oleiphilus sp. HI0061]KZZ34295.1 hypothetical protein A3756_18050 [Oleiphilus sp. HI0086]
MKVPSRFEELAGNELQLLALLCRPSLTKGQAEFVKPRLPIVNISKLNELVAHHRVSVAKGVGDT